MSSIYSTGALQRRIALINNLGDKLEEGKKIFEKVIEAHGGREVESKILV